MVTHQLQAERRTGSVHRPKTGDNDDDGNCDSNNNEGGGDDA